MEGKQQLLTMPASSPFRYRMFSGEGGLGARKYRLQVPTPGSALLGAAWAAKGGGQGAHFRSWQAHVFVMCGQVKELQYGSLTTPAWADLSGNAGSYLDGVAQEPLGLGALHRHHHTSARLELPPARQRHRLAAHRLHLGVCVGRALCNMPRC